MDVKIGAAYVRVSTDDQLEYSPDSQLKLIREYAKREGFIIPDEYVYKDDGISGKLADKRPAFRLMIATAKEEHPFDCIFVWKYSRFARNQEESIMYKNLLRKRGIDVKSISEPSSDSPFASLIERIIEWMDEYYLINLSGEVKRGMKEKSLRGEAMGRPPFGYSVKDKALVPNEDAGVVRYIFEQYAAGKSCRAIAAGFAGVHGMPNAQVVKYILRNPAYIGKIRWDEDGKVNYNSQQYVADISELPDGKHEPIVSKDVWDAAQERLANDKEIRYQRKEHKVFMLKGLVRCSNCGATLVDVTGRAREDKPRMQCCRYVRGQCKVSHFITTEKANAAVLSALEDIIGSETFVFAPRRPLEAKLSRDWDKLIAKEQTRLERARMALLDGAFSSEEYKQLKESVTRDIQKLEAARDKEAPAPVDEKAFAAKTVEIMSVLRSPDVDEEAKNLALRAIIEKIVFNKFANTFDIYFLP